MKTAILALAGSTTAISNSATRYSPFAQSGATASWTTSVAAAQTPISAAGTISRLRVRLGTALSAGSFTFTLVKNGVDTALTCTITNQQGSDTSNTVTVAAGDLLCIKCVPSGTPTAQTAPVALAVMFEGDVAGESVVFAATSTGTTAGFIAPGSLTVANATEVNQSAVMPTGGVFSHLRVSLSAAPGTTTTRVFTLRKNGVDTTLTCTVTSGNTTASDTSNSVTFAAGDVISIGQTTPAGTPATATANIGLKWVPTTDGQGLMFGNWNSAISASATRYGNANGTSGAGEATEANTYNIAPCDLSISDFRAAISTAPGAAKSRAFTLRKNGAGTAAAITISGASDTSGTDADTVTFTDADLLSIETVPTGTPAAVTFARTSAIVVASSAAITLTLTEVPFDGFVFPLGPSGEAAAISVTGTQDASITSIEARVELSDGTVVTNWSTTRVTLPTSTTWAFTSTSATYPTRTDGKDYVLKVRDANNTANEVVANRKWAPGVVLALNDQSQFEKLFSDGESPATGAPSTPTTNNVRAMWCPNKATAVVLADGTITGDRISTATLTGSGWTEIANQMGIDWSSAHIPVMLVDMAYTGMSIDDWNADTAVASGKWGLRTGFMQYLANQCKNRITGIIRMAVLDATGGMSTALDTLAGHFDTAFSSNPTAAKILLVPSMRYGEPQSTSYNYQSMRNAFVAKAATGGRWSILCWLLAAHMDEDRAATPGNAHHQAQGAAGTYTGATPHLRGNRWLGRVIGRAIGAWLQGYLGQSVTLSAFGPRPSSAMFTDATKTAFTVDFDKALKQRDTGGVIRGCWLSTDTWALSGGAYTANSFEMTTGYTLSISGNRLTVTLPSAATGNPKFDVLRGAPFDSVSVTETDVITLLDRSLWGTDSFDDGVSTGLQAVPVQGDGITIRDYAPATGGRRMQIGLGIGL